jgi:putative two-component system response regulator
MENEKPLIILVDDNPANLRIGKNVLSEKFAVATAPSAEKLFGLLENNKPAMILLDVDMPEMNGYEAIKVLKSKPKFHDIPVIFVTGRTESDDELAGLSLGAIDYITKPFQPSLLLKRIEAHLLVEAQKKKLEKQAAELQYFNDNLQKMVEEKTASVINMQNALLKTMAELVECRDDITGGHIERTQKGIKILLAEIQKNGLYREEAKNWNVELLLQSSQLHDVGKISIDDSILKKPGKLNDEEFEAMKKHAAFGEKIIEKIETLAKENDFLNYAKIFAASHHEKWDGTGYPNGLKGNDIPLLGRIMAIADVYDALTSVRPYKKAFPHEEAVRIITEGSGKQFDPALIEIFIQTADQFKGIISSPTAP